MVRRRMQATVQTGGLTFAEINELHYKKGLQAKVMTDNLTQSQIELHAKLPYSATVVTDTQTRPQLTLIAAAPLAATVKTDSKLDVQLNALQKKVIGIAPEATLILFSVDGGAMLEGSTLLRGVSYSILATLVGQELGRFQTFIFCAKTDPCQPNELAPIYKNSNLDSSSVSLLGEPGEEYESFLTPMGAMQRCNIQIRLNPKDTAFLQKRTTLFWEFQADETLDESHAWKGRFYVDPDVYHNR